MIPPNLCVVPWHGQLIGVLRVLRTEELAVAGEGAGLELEQLAGMSWDLGAARWRLSPDPGVNYIAYFQKPGLVRG